MEKPKPFLVRRLSDQISTPNYSSICPGFELKKWRFERLAAHLIDWLPDFAIRQDELPETITNTTDFRKVFEIAAKRIYDTEKTTSRGEIGELLLHVACREFSDTYPTVSKVYYKTSSNDVVKGFDLVHTRFDQKTEKLELWLGEAKFFDDGARAVADAAVSINRHLDAGFLNSEKILLGGKISSDTPGYSKLQWLFDRDTPIDEIFDRLVIPILIAYNSDACANFVDAETYETGIQSEIIKLQEKVTNRLSASLSFYCFYVPMNSKMMLIDAFDKKLGAYL